MDIPENTINTAFFMIDHAIDSVRTGETLIPFIIVDRNKERSLQRVVADRIEEAAIKARELASQYVDEAELVGVAIDGYITIDGKRTDAIMVEIYEGGQAEGVQFAQRYKRGLFNKLKLIGNPACIGRVDLVKTKLYWRDDSDGYSRSDH